MVFQAILPGGHQLSLAHETPQHLHVFTLEDLYRNTTPRLLINRLIHIRHTPLANHTPNFVAVEGFPLKFCHMTYSLLPSAILVSRISITCIYKRSLRLFVTI